MSIITTRAQRRELARASAKLPPYLQLVPREQWPDPYAPQLRVWRSRAVPMHPRLRCCAHYRQVESSATSAYFRAARDAAGMPWLHFHDLRHSAASELINRGIDLYTVGAVLGHRSSQSTARYAHLATDTMRAAIDRIGQKITHRGAR